MARARLLKPGFFANETLTEIHPFGRLLFAGLWTLADREGRLPDRPKWIKGAIFPYETVNVAKLLKELESLGFIMRYEAEEQPYIEIVKFKKHQHVHINEADSTIPAPYSHRAGIPNVETNPSASTSTSKAEATSTTEPRSGGADDPPEHLLHNGKRPVHVVDPIDQIAADFAAFGKATAGTPRAIEEAVQDYGQEWTALAVRRASGAGFDGEPPWSYVEQQLRRWKKQGHPDEVEIDAGNQMARGANGAAQARGAAPVTSASYGLPNVALPVFLPDAGPDGVGA